MAHTTKVPSSFDANQTLQNSFNEVNSTLSTDGFLVGKVGHKVAMAISTTSIANDTETYTYSDSGTTLYVIKIIYTSGTRDTMLSAERTA